MERVNVIIIEHNSLSPGGYYMKNIIKKKIYRRRNTYSVHDHGRNISSCSDEYPICGHH